MIEPGRTNAVPRTLIALCIGLFFLRASAVFYGTYYQKTPVNLISWQQPKPIDRSRQDLLSKPTLYFFYDTSDQFHTITAQVFESMLFHNREVARQINSEFIPVKVSLNEEETDALANSLSKSFSVYSFPSVYIALPNGKQVSHTTWNSDRMFQAFLNDSLITAVSKAAAEAMRTADWSLAIKAYERASKENFHGSIPNPSDAINWSIALRHQKNEARAKEVLEAELRKNKLPKIIASKDDWPVPCIDYLLGKISRDELMKKATGESDKYGYKGSTLHYVLGENLLLDGRQEDAIKELRIAAEDTRSPYLYSAKYARAQLRALGEKVPEEKEDEDNLGL